MKTSPLPKSANSLTLIVAAAVADLLWLPLTVRGQALSGTSLTVTGSTTLQGNVSVTGTDSVIDFYGNSLYFGTATTGSATQPGISALYTEGIASKFSLISAQPSHQWFWGYFATSGSSAPLMTLDGTNGLTIYDTSGHSVVLKPNTNTSGLGTVLTQEAADSRYVSSANFTVGSALDWSGTLQPTISLAGGTATGVGSFAGIFATASGYWSIASGYRSTASGDRSTASGAYSTASGYVSIASGYLSTASGAYSTASGIWSTASGYRSTASGYISNASGYGSTASGYGSTASGYWSTAAGPYTIASACREFVAGQYNVISQDSPDHWVPTDDLFVVGNGAGWQPDQNGDWQEYRSNALVIKKNGDTTLYGTLTVSGTSGGVVVAGTVDENGIIVASGSTQLVLIPQQGDLSMGDFHAGVQPPISESGQALQQQMQSLAAKPAAAGVQTPSSSAVGQNAAKATLMKRINAIRNGTTQVH